MQSLEIQTTVTSQLTMILCGWKERAKATFRKAIGRFLKKDTSPKDFQTRVVKPFWESNSNLYASVVMKDHYHRMGPERFLIHYISKLDDDDVSLKLKAVIESTIAPIYKSVTGQDYNNFKTIIS